MYIYASKKNLTMKIIFQMNSLALQDKNIYSLLGVCFPCGSAGKESACSVTDLGLIPGLGRSPGEGKGYPLQYSGLENSMDCTVHRVAESYMTEQLSLTHSTGSLVCTDSALKNLRTEFNLTLKRKVFYPSGR